MNIFWVQSGRTFLALRNKYPIIAYAMNFYYSLILHFHFIFVSLNQVISILAFPDHLRRIHSIFPTHSARQLIHITTGSI